MHVRGTRIDAVDVLQHLRAQPELQSIPAIVWTGGVLTEDEKLIVPRQRAHLVHKRPEGFEALIEFLDQLIGRDQPH